MRILISFLCLICFICALEGGDITVRFGDVSGQPGEMVKMPVYCTYQEPLYAAYFALTFDLSRVVPLSYSVDGTAANAVNPLSVFLEVDENACICGIGYRESNNNLSIEPIPPGEDVHVGDILVRILSNAPLGDTTIEPVSYVSTPMFKFGAVLKFNRYGDGPSPSHYVAGVVHVMPPVGPRPVGDLQCEQLLDRIHLSYTLTEAYDAIDIVRDGAIIETVPGTQMAYIDPMTGTGETDYTLVAYKNGVPSISVHCRLDVTTPVAPAVKDLHYQEDGLYWKNPVTFDKIYILRDSEHVAELSGESTSYADPSLDGAVALYTVITELEGYRSPAVNCTANGVWTCEIGDVQVPIDATTFKLPVYASILEPIQGFSLAISLDDPKFRLVQDPALTIADTVLYQDPDFITINYNPLGGIGGGNMNNPPLPTLAVVFTIVPGSLDAMDAKMTNSGLRQNIANFYFECIGPFFAGDVYKVAVEQIVFANWGGYSKLPDIQVPGEIHFGASATQPVQNLQAVFSPTPQEKSGTSTVSLSWHNTSRYDALRVTRNGEQITELPGTVTAYQDNDVPAGFYVYKVVALSGETTSFPANLFLNTVMVPSAFLRCDSNRDGRIDLADAIFTLYFLFNDQAAKCEDAMDGNDDGKLNLADAIFTLTYLFQDGVVVPSPSVYYPWFDPTDDALTCLE